MIGEQTLISRTAKMLRDRSAEAVFLAPTHYVAYVLPYEVISKTYRMNLLEAISYSQHTRGSERTVILLGDVVFSHRILDSLLHASDDEVIFAGRQVANSIIGKNASELFGVSVPAKYYDELDYYCRWMNDTVRPRGYPPKLWAIARLFVGLEQYDETSHLPNVGFGPPDFTDDIDSPSEYLAFFKLLSAAALEDDWLVPSAINVSRGPG